MKKHRIVITTGEPAGIGPDLIVYLAQRCWEFELVVCGNASLLKNRAALLNLPLTILPYKGSFQSISQKASTLTLLSIPLKVPVIPGHLHVKNSFYVIETLKRACHGCLNGEFSALVTGPVHKGIINEAGIPFTGHTEFFQESGYSSKVVMMLANEKMRVALVTTHLPIRKISSVITKTLLRKVITILHRDLHLKFGILNPRILVCGLNPHAGEHGYIGTEEIDTIIPVLKEMKAKGLNIRGPFSADTIFQKKYLDHTDAILAMYHDQGLPVLKYQGFHQSVNISLGLPFIRTSVDHGTALDLAGHGKADVGSFVVALNFAFKMIAKFQ